MKALGLCVPDSVITLLYGGTEEASVQSEATANVIV